MAVCRYCGNENRQEARFCRHCGKSIENPVDQEQPEAPQAPTTSENTGTVESELRTGAEAEKLPPDIGSYLYGRYQITSMPEDEDVCYAEDHLKCWSCLSEQRELSQAYCEACGVALSHWPRVSIPVSSLVEDQEVHWQSKNEPSGVIYLQDTIIDQTSIPEEELRLKIQHGYGIHAGLVRENNEDSLMLLNLSNVSEKQEPVTVALYAVADGIGGHESGEVASKLAVNELTTNIILNIVVPAFSGEPATQDDIEDKFKKSVISVNQSILDLKAHMLDNDMGCTLTAVLILDWQGYVINIGDSRTYMMRDGELCQITEDHSMVAKLVSLGIIQPEEIRTHESRNVIFRSLGASPDLQIDLYRISLLPDDRLLLCSDGLWEMVGDNMVEDVLLEYYGPQNACDHLVELAIQAGGQDNISVINVLFLGDHYNK